MMSRMTGRRKRNRLIRCKVNVQKRGKFWRKRLNIWITIQNIKNLGCNRTSIWVCYAMPRIDTRSWTWSGTKVIHEIKIKSRIWEAWNSWMKTLFPVAWAKQACKGKLNSDLLLCFKTTWTISSILIFQFMIKVFPWPTISQASNRAKITRI